MDPFSAWVATASIFYLLSGPAPLKETAILLPEADGKSSGIVIKTMDSETAVTEPYQGVELTGGKIETKQFSAESVQQMFPDVMQALPEKPHSYTLHFEESGTDLTPESAAMIENIRQEIVKRSAPEITVIGHTDRTGSPEDNLSLSLKRAEAIRDILVAGGVSAQIIQTVGRGELEPVVETEDGVAEPRNRRVVISVR
jgi:OmpA-OmpF porin, OOP family